MQSKHQPKHQIELCVAFLNKHFWIGAPRVWGIYIEMFRNGNPYHNNLHAADVLQTTHWFISQAGLKVTSLASGLAFTSLVCYSPGCQISRYSVFFCPPSSTTTTTRAPPTTSTFSPALSWPSSTTTDQYRKIIMCHLSSSKFRDW